MKIALKSPMTLFILGERDDVIKFFSLCDEILLKDKISNRELITDRLYRRYVRFSDVPETQKIIAYLRDKFDKLGLGYKKYFELFESMFDEVTFLKNNDELFGRIQICVGQIPYSSTDISKSNEFYDTFSNDSKPFWTRDIF